MEAAIQAPDRGEALSLIEPLRLGGDSRHRPALIDLSVELATASAGFRRSLPEGTVQALATLVRSMNCYYSNLIEGHHTHPVDIERAMRGDYSTEPRRRDLQLEARAHVEVQAWIDDGGLTGRSARVASLREIHARFAGLLPETLRSVHAVSEDARDAASDETSAEVLTVEPGALRTRDVQVGRHVAISPGAVPRFLERFEQAYDAPGRAEGILAAAAAHHRLLWIHPFLDGNGRVARLMSHAMLLDLLDTGAIWSVARGLARREAEYKAHLMACDLPRCNDLDGRGHLSEENLAAFTRFFLDVCLDQVRFMTSLVQPDRLRARILDWVREEQAVGALPPGAERVLDAVLGRGELPRGDVPGLLNASDRHARRITAALVDRGVLVSASSRAPLRITFPAALASRWMPGLFPDAP